MRMLQCFRMGVLTLAAVLLICSAPVPAFAEPVEAGRVALDVIFVIDNSGSMLRADPYKLALTATNLFIDICEDSDSRVGYVMYTHVIRSFQPLTDVDEFSKQLKNAISATEYQNDGDTDTAMGLEKAYELLSLDSLEGKSSREPVIILLSDGNTDLPKGITRTTNQSLVALEEMTKTLTDAGVPVYTIGLNYDGKLDTAAMNAIAETTGAMAQDVTTAEELLPVVHNIYADLADAEGDTIGPFVATGEPQSVKIPIENNSIYMATITIRGKEPIKDGSMSDPSGTAYDEQDASGKLTVSRDQGGRYMLLKLYYPVMGDWTLTFTGTKDDQVFIDLLSVYDLNLVMEDPATAYRAASISFHFEDSAGSKISDPSLIDGVQMTLHNSDDDTELGVFPVGQDSYTFTLDPGNHSAYLKMVNNGIVRISNTKTFQVPAEDPIRLIDPAEDTAEVALTTLFHTQEDVFLDDYVLYAKYNEPLSVHIKSGDWEELLDLNYDKTDLKLHMTALKHGNKEAEITVTAVDGSSVVLYINTNIRSGWWFVIIASVILLVIAGGIILFLLSRRPNLNSVVRDIPVQVNLPDSQIDRTPPEATLRLETVKVKRSLQQVIEYNREYSVQYNTAFEGISWFATGTVFTPKKNAIEITIPHNSQYIIRIDNKKQSGSYTARFTKNSRLTVEMARDEDIYQIIFGGGNDSSPDSEWDRGVNGFDFSPKGHDGGFAGDGFDF